MKFVSPTFYLSLVFALCCTTLSLQAQNFVTSGANIITNPAFTATTSRIGVGVTAPLALLDMRSEGAYAQGQIRSTYFAGATANSPSFAWFRGRGTIAAPAACAVGDYLGSFNAYGYTDGTYANSQAAGLFGFRVDGAVSPGIVPTQFIIQTGTSSATRAQRLEVTSAGVVRINGFAGVGNRMVVTDPTGALSAIAIPPATSQWITTGNNINYPNAAGNVGVNTATPLYKMHVTTTAANGAAANGFMHTGAGGVSVGTGAFNSSIGWIGTNSAHPLGFGTNSNTSQMYLGTNGNFGIGTNTTPGYKLTVQSTGDGLVQTDGTTRLGTYVAGGYGWMGTHGTEPFYLATAYSTYSGMRIGYNPAANGAITFGGSDDTRSKITSFGNVGLTSAMFRDSLTGGTGVSVVNGTNFSTGSPWSGTTSNIYWTATNGFQSISKGYGSFIGTTATDGKMSFWMTNNTTAADQYAGGSERMSLSNTGDLTVTGATAVGTNLTVAGTTALTGAGTIANKFTATHNSSTYDGGYNSGQVNLIENEDDYSRLTFSSSINTGSWHIASYLGAANTDDRLNIYNNIVGNVLTCSGTNGNVGIGVLNPANKLEVCGTIRATEVLVQTGWCDYVFNPNYKLRPLAEVKAFIQQNQHLPDVTKGDEIEQNGLLVGNGMQEQIRKIEELTLYAIEQDETIKAANEKMATQDASIQKMNTLLEAMNTRLNALEQENKTLKTNK